MQIIQIRGGNATGKTTTVRQFVNKHNLKIEEIIVNGQKTYISTNNKDIVVLGRYDKLNGGCDLFEGREHVTQTIIYIIKTMRPKTIIFEGFIYGLSYKFGCDVQKLAQIFGYEYLAITLIRDENNGLNILYKRNGAVNINEKNFLSKYKASISAHKKLKNSGIKALMVNTDNVQEKEMYKIIENNMEK